MRKHEDPVVGRLPLTDLPRLAEVVEYERSLWEEWKHHVRSGYTTIKRRDCSFMAKADHKRLKAVLERAGAFTAMDMPLLQDYKFLHDPSDRPLEWPKERA